VTSCSCLPTPYHERHGGLWESREARSNLTSLTNPPRRELAEELGIDIESMGEPEFSIADSDSPFLIVFVPTTITGKATCHEHTAPPGSLQLPLSPSDRRYVEFFSPARPTAVPSGQPLSDELYAALERWQSTRQRPAWLT
jgi:8-oxo-dGTP pyrophosphatase MutT (NUDIX family)